MIPAFLFSKSFQLKKLKKPEGGVLLLKKVPEDRFREAYHESVKNGDGLNELSNKLGVSKKTVRLYCKACGLSLTPLGNGRGAKAADKFMEAYEKVKRAGGTTKDLAKLLNYCEKTVLK